MPSLRKLTIGDIERLRTNDQGDLFWDGKKIQMGNDRSFKQRLADALDEAKSMLETPDTPNESARLAAAIANLRRG